MLSLIKLSPIVLCLLLVCPLLVQSGRYGCFTPINAIPGCVCASIFSTVDFTYKTTLTCSGIPPAITIVQLKENLNKLNGYDIDDLIINNFPLSSLPGDVFDEKTIIRRIIINNSPKLEAFGSKDNSFFSKIATNVESIIIANSPNIQREQWLKLSEALAGGGGVDDGTRKSTRAGGRLRDLVIYKNINFDVDNLADFEKVAPTIERLILKGTGITKITPDLTSFSALRYLDISETPNLKTFELKVELPVTLHTINLKGTSIAYFEKDSHKNLGKALFVDITGSNKLDCNCDKIGTENINVEAFIKRFDGAKCGIPSQLVNQPYGTICLEKNRQSFYTKQLGYKPLSMLAKFINN
ncbi:uncharacterized protein LOC128957730 [Oppia nitens]|uniref:uncharacterized protein LOC128957730 n=1 Tax=Oppia nitens TaxID=1686743 RepID=UPI0023D9AF5E|nr:uncharacterized protein LOC128957730 [Oppia nitens]